MVKSFVADEWTLEYDLAFFGLAKSVYVAACLAKKDEARGSKGEDFDQEKQEDEVTRARSAFNVLTQKADEAVKNGTANGCCRKELLAAMVYAKFAKERVSKAIAAQYLAECLQTKHKNGEITFNDLCKRLPTYLIEAIDYVTGAQQAGPNGQKATNE